MRFVSIIRTFRNVLLLTPSHPLLRPHNQCQSKHPHKRTVSHLQHRCWKSSLRFPMNYYTDVEAEEEAGNKLYGWGRRGRGSRVTIASNSQVENRMTLGFCYLRFCFPPSTWKSDVATNPKSLSLSLTASLPHSLPDSNTRIHSLSLSIFS